MSFFDNKERRSCFIACSQEKINSGQCVCLNNMNQTMEPSNFKIYGENTIRFIGLKPEEAIDLLEEGETSRIVSEDGVPYVVTHDLHINRWNFELQNGVIVNATKG